MRSLRLLPLLLVPLWPQPAAAAALVLRVPQGVATLSAAISQVANGGTIELAAGAYAAPAAGFKISNAHKGFTIRGAAGATVALDGGGDHPVLMLRNSSRGAGKLVVFQNLIFRNGGGGSSTTSPGVTVDAGEARFVGCRFENNRGATGADGGGVKVRNGSDAAFVGCNFTGNASPIAGGAMMVNASTVEVIGGSFVDNHVNLPNSSRSSHGGAINVVDGTLRVSDVLFRDNQAGWVGGAIFALSPPGTSPGSSVSLTRSTFQTNVIAPQPCCPPPGVTTGGAIHVEDQTTLDVTDSRFVDNQAQFGGALDSYRALINVSGSVFQGNGGALTGTAESVGGAICALSNDLVGSSTEGGKNPRPAAVMVSGSLVQGRHAGGPPVANAGGCILADGDEQHLYGLGGLTPNGTLASNRTPITITDSVFDDCDIQASPTAGGGSGGAINGSLVALTLADSLMLDSDAALSGGAIFLARESTASIAGTTFAGNTAGASGGAIFASGSNLDVGGSRFIANEVSPGIFEPIGSSRGAALFSSPLGASQPHAGSGDSSGSVAETLFSQNVGLPVWDIDFGGGIPVNTMQYNGNDFFNTTFGDRVYVDTFTDPSRSGSNVGSLNSLVVNRSGSSTDKSVVPNDALFRAPSVGSLRVIPPAGASAARSAPFLAYAWSGGSATLNGGQLARHEGLFEGLSPGTYELVVDGLKVDSVVIEAPHCTSDATLCLAKDRFRLQVQWEGPTGEQGEGHPVALSSDTGYFWFFDPSNAELVVKVLDGRAVNQRFWVLYGALSDVHYTLTVTDTVTGAVQAYVNPAGHLASAADTAAFLGTGEAPAVPPVVAPTPPPRGACASGPTQLCLSNRFRVAISWKANGAQGVGTAVPLTGETGYFWFFDSANVELVVKVLDGRTVNQKFWLFYGALSDVEYTVTVTDTQTGHTKTYFNPVGRLSSVADTAAFPGQ